MTHSCFLEISAKNNYELGLQLGEIFKNDVLKALGVKIHDSNWTAKKQKAQKYLEITIASFPQYIEELKGYAKGSGVSFDDFWTLFIGAELDNLTEEKCTSMVTNGGMLIGATEDCFAEVKNEIYLLKKNINDLTILELYYSYSLGGDSISINSNGFVQMTNTLSHTDSQVGIPRNITGRWLSETSNPEDDFKKLVKLKRSSGYSHTIASANGKCWNIELTAKRQQLTKITLPFVHTNHYLTGLKKYQSNDYSSGVCQGTNERYNYANKYIKKNITRVEMQKLLSNTSNGPITSIFNERTIGRIIVDLQNMKAIIWLLREAEKGWLEYPLDFI